MMLGYFVSFVLGVYAAGAVLSLRRNIRSMGVRTLRRLAIAFVRASLWPLFIAETMRSSRASERQRAEAEQKAHSEAEQKARAEAEQKARYEQIKSVDDIDEAYRLCLEFLNARPFVLGDQAYHVPYAEMLRQRVIGGEADGPRMLHMLGLIALSQIDASTARRFLERALGADAEDAEIHNSLGFALYQERKFSSASLVLARAAALRPDLSAAQTNLNLARASMSGGVT